MNACVQFQVVFSLKTLLADLTLEPATNAMRGEVASEISLAWKNLILERKDILIILELLLLLQYHLIFVGSSVSLTSTV